MPRYDYKCRVCGEEYELTHAFDDDSIKTCPDCGAGRLMKVFSPSAIRFNGKGFYSTDYRS